MTRGMRLNCKLDKDRKEKKNLFKCTYIRGHEKINRSGRE
jgi:hypothetical protein